MVQGYLMSEDFAKRGARAIRKSERDPATPPPKRRRVNWPQSASGGAQIVRFTVATVDCDTGDFTGTVTNIMCSGSDAAIGDTITLVDPIGWLTGCSALLINHTGLAVKMIDENPYGDCAYEIISMDDLGANCA